MNFYYYSYSLPHTTASIASFPIKQGERGIGRLIFVNRNSRLCIAAMADCVTANSKASNLLFCFRINFYEKFVARKIQIFNKLLLDFFFDL